MTDTGSVEVAVILAAGQGSRMGGLGRVVPKALMPVLDRPLLIAHLDLLARNGVRHACIVIGHLGDDVRAAVAAHPVPGIGVSFHVQAERRGLGHAVLKAEDAVAGHAFVLILADIAFTMDDELRLFRMGDGMAGLVAVRTETDVDAIRRNFSVVHDADGRISRVVEKPVHLPNWLKGTGQYAFSPALFDAIRNTPPSALRGEIELTDAIQTLIDGRQPVHVLDAIGWDMNLTTPDDVIACNRHYLSRNGMDVLLGTPLPAGSRSSACVVGTDVRFGGPVMLERCVVLDGADVAAGAELRDCVVTTEGVWRSRDE